MPGSTRWWPEALLPGRAPAPDPVHAGDRPQSRVLPFTLDVPVRSYLNHAFPLSIVSRFPAHEPRLYESFIQLFFPDDKAEYDRVMMLPALATPDWARLGFMETEQMDPRDPRLRRPDALSGLLADHLARGCYVEIHIDEFFLPGRPCHGRVHSVHDNMIVGYDWPRGIFHLAGYATEYELSTVAFDDVVNGFHRAPWNERARRYLRLLTPREPEPRPFDVAAVAGQLADYLHSRPGMTPDEMRAARLYWKARRFTGRWGLDAYGAFAEYTARQVRDGKPLDLRATRTLWEHKACMLARLRYLEAADLFRGGRLFSAPYAPVEAAARLLRFAAYEHNARGCGPGPLEPAAALLRDMRATEEAVLSDALASLHHSR